MDKDIINLTFKQYLKPINLKKFNNLIEKLELDKYAKKLTTFKLISLLIFGQLLAIRSLEYLSLRVSNNENLQKVLRLKSISASQLSRKLRDLPPSLTYKIFKYLAQEILIERGAEYLRRNLNQVHLIDATTITMALSQYRWADFRKTKAGIKVNLRVVFDGDKTIPDKAVISPAIEADKTKMDDLVISTTANALHIFDRAYVDYEKFDNYTENQTLFISRLKKNALVEIIDSSTTLVDGKKVKESTIRLGNPGITRMRNNLRLLEVPDDRDPNKIIRIITNDFERSAQEIGDLYRNRWQIELFFKWIKQHLNVQKLHGFSQNAVENQILIALITYLLLNMFKKRAKTTKTLLTVQRMLITCKYDTFEEFIKKINKPPSKESLGRRKINYDEIFEFTYQQVIEGNIEHLYSTDYDPLVV